ncbi:hypothetical protein K1T71_008638 [Dendrolimus kikuchii]|uniref:Uncharacterized protein n=1 Tax=Dendrolimus kikuchii TaxID=765133 RepID=A0ACC1CVI3_9NEOP|nr:hypothetical protein K1T71_008638 [Dendrolimus kikuchii]
MSINDHISLIDLRNQFPFEIDDTIKQQLCFGETLIVSCGHYEGDVGDESSDSEWSCQESSESEKSEEIKEENLYEINNRVEEETEAEQDEEEEDDFHIFFFPDCTKPPPKKNSKASVIIVDGLPKINPVMKHQKFCTCAIDKTGKCECHTKLPCHCGAKTTAECTCSKLKDICICHKGPPQTTCKCKGSDVCVCHPEGKIQPVCTCDLVAKPCVCYKGKFPSPICTCAYKPKFNLENIKSIDELASEASEQTSTSQAEENVTAEQEPCLCQQSEIKVKGEECTCDQVACICGSRKTCVCEPTASTELICKDNDSKSICSCPTDMPCTCDGDSVECKCFPNPNCTCDNPDNCKCFTICECTDPCICDIQSAKPEECICLDNRRRGIPGVECACICKQEEVKKLKRVRAGKHGYRWCRDVDPKHTYFDYGYNQHDKISYEVQEREKLKILGLYDGKENEEECAVHAVKAPPYKKKIRKPSLDCCSVVGGISISVETLGEDKDKFLVQIVSHSSKEGAKSGSKLVSILDCNLHTMEENRTEHITKKDVIKERKSYMAICASGYYNKVTRTCGERHLMKRFYHSFDVARNFVLEGANVVLMRYLGLRRYRGNIKTGTVLIDGTICESIYVCLGVSQAIVNNKPLFVVKIERHIIEPSGFIHQTLTVLTLRGYMVSHEWADNCYILHLNPLLNIVPEKDEIEPHPPLREKWREDLQLFSDYLDFKSVRSSEGGQYVTESRALTATIRDYLQAILLLKPQDTLHFTRHYFGSVLSALDLPHDEYFDPASRHVRYYFFEE